MTSSSSRYEGKPLLKLLESYVLWAIDELPAKDEKLLTQMTPKLQSIYGLQGDWQQVISAVMELPPNMPRLIRELWVKNTAIASKNGVTLAPQHFAEMFVDNNVDMLDPTCGSGASLRAAESLGANRVLGIEKNLSYCESARKELAHHRAMNNLFDVQMEAEAEDV